MNIVTQISQLREHEQSAAHKPSHLDLAAKIFNLPLRDGQDNKIQHEVASDVLTYGLVNMNVTEAVKTEQPIET